MAVKKSSKRGATPVEAIRHQDTRVNIPSEIDEGAWSSLYSTTSRPFPRPSTGKIAIKVINHYGDEVLKVFEP